MDAVALHGISGHAGDEGDQHFIIFLPNLPGHAYAIHAGQLNVKQQQIIAAYGIVMIQHIRPVVKNAQLAYFIQFSKIILDFLTDLRLVQSIVFHKRDFHEVLLSRSYFCFMKRVNETLAKLSFSLYQKPPRMSNMEQRNRL